MKLAVYSIAALFSLDVAPSCGRSPHRPIPPPPAVETPLLAPPIGPSGAVLGKVKFLGKSPEMSEQKRGVDPFCKTKAMKEEEVVVSSEGTLKNVLLRVQGAPATPPPTEKATMDQRDCRYEPRVLPVVRGQKVAIHNGDPTLHNVHGYLGTKTEFNDVQVPESPNLDRVFEEDGVMHKLKCDIHQWMTGYVWVQSNRYFAVTGDDGSYRIEGVPVGTYKLWAWHERFGWKSAELIIEIAKPATVNFEYTEKDNTAPR